MEGKCMKSQRKAQGENRFPGACIDLASPGIVVGGTWHPPVAYLSYLPQTRFYRQAALCGIHLYSFPAYLAGRGINIRSGIGLFRKGLWRDDDCFDFADIHEDMAKILEADPAAQVIMRLHLDVPEWWERNHPEGCCQRGDGTTLRQSFTSPVWREAAGAALRRVVDWLSESPYAAHLAGIHVAAGGTEEWFYHSRGRFEDANPPRSPPIWRGAILNPDRASARGAGARRPIPQRLSLRCPPNRSAAGATRGAKRPRWKPSASMASRSPTRSGFSARSSRRRAEAVC